MIAGQEIASDVWVLRNDESGRNTGIILRMSGAIVVNPGLEQVEIAAVESFLSEMGRGVEAVLLTSAPERDALEEQQSGTEDVSSPPAASSPLPGWEVVTLGGGRLGLYNSEQRILFCGDILQGDRIPDLKNGTESYLNAVDGAEALNAKVVVPLYGPEAMGKREIKARIEQDRSYVMSLLRHVATSQVSRAPLSRVLEVATEVYEEYPHLQAHLRNIEYAWAELGG